MNLARARRVVAASGAVVALVAVAGLVTFGGPAESRRDEREARRLSDLQSVAAALICHAEAGATPAAPVALEDVSPACLAPGQAAALVDPQTGAAYAIERPADGAIRVCAAFERPGATPQWAPPSFDAETGCLTLPLPQPRDAEN